MKPESFKNILLLEEPLEEFLVSLDEQRGFREPLRGFLQTLPVAQRPLIFHERIHDGGDLEQKLAWCARQNGMAAAEQREDGVCRPSEIGFIHLVGHGDEGGQLLRTLGPRALGTKFAPLKGSGVRAVILSSCFAGGQREIAKAITDNAIPCVIGYDTEVDDVTATMAELLFYRSLSLHPTDPLWSIVLGVNDALYAIGTPTKSLLTCWVAEGTRLLGPAPIWTSGAIDGDPAYRGFLPYIRERLAPDAQRSAAEKWSLIEPLLAELGLPPSDDASSLAKGAMP